MRLAIDSMIVARSFRPAIPFADPRVIASKPVEGAELFFPWDLVHPVQEECEGVWVRLPESTLFRVLP